MTAEETAVPPAATERENEATKPAAPATEATAEASSSAKTVEPASEASNAADAGKPDAVAEESAETKTTEAVNEAEKPSTITKADKPSATMKHESALESKEEVEQKNENKGVSSGARDEEEKEESEEQEEKLPPRRSMSGRVRKTVQHFAPATPQKVETKLEIAEGSGLALREIENIEMQIDRTKADELTEVHRLLFKVPGKQLERKKHIRAFSGIPHDEKHEKEVERIEKKLMFYTMKGLSELTRLFDLKSTGGKEEVIKRIMVFLEKPQAEHGSRSIVKPKKRGKTKKKGSKKSKSKSKKKRSAKSPGEKPKKKAKKASKPKAKQDDSIIEDSDAAAESSDDESDSSDDEPLFKAKPSKPSRDELEETVRKILRGADLKSLGRKSARKLVEAKYPNIDLSDEKEFLNEKIQEIATELMG
eukprot:Clim_evm3s56 gene=Clim_evmTU3s56